MISTHHKEPDHSFQDVVHDEMCLENGQLQSAPGVVGNGSDLIE